MQITFPTDQQELNLDKEYSVAKQSSGIRFALCVQYDSSMPHIIEVSDLECMAMRINNQMKNDCTAYEKSQCST